MRQRWPAWLPSVLLVVVCCTAHVASIRLPLFQDDAYEIRRALDDDPRSWLFVYSYASPSPDMPWWASVVYERRVVRILPSAILTAEVRLVGYNPLALHLGNLALVAATLVILFRLLARWTGDTRAAWLATAVVAVHPATDELVLCACNLPLVAAGIAGAVTVLCWDRMRRSGSTRAFVGAVLGGLLAVTSYEAMVLLPIGIVAVDALLFRGRTDVPRGAWPPRLAMLAVLVVYVGIVKVAQPAAAHPDYEAMRPIGAVLEALGVDTLAYVAKTFALVDPTNPWAYWFLNAVGLVAAIAILGALTVALLAFAKDRRLAWIGLVAFAVLLAPPLVTRAAVSLMNLPSNRQVYLPMLFGLAPMLAAVLVRERGKRIAFGVVGAFALWSAIQSLRIGTQEARFQLLDDFTATVERTLAGQDRTKTLVVVGDPTPCGFTPAFAWPGDIVFAFPSAKPPDAEIAITADDDRTLTARSPGGFSGVVLDQPALPRDRSPFRYNRGISHALRQPVFTPQQTTYRTYGATIELVERKGAAPTVLRARLDRPLRDSIVVQMRGVCDGARILQF